MAGNDHVNKPKCFLACLFLYPGFIDPYPLHHTILKKLISAKHHPLECRSVLPRVHKFLGQKNLACEECPYLFVCDNPGARPRKGSKAIARTLPEHHSEAEKVWNFGDTWGQGGGMKGLHAVHGSRFTVLPLFSHGPCALHSAEGCP